MRVSLTFFLLVIAVLAVAVLIPCLPRPSFTPPPSPSDKTEAALGPQPSAAPAAQVAATVLYPALFICHGGGPLPVLGDPQHAEMVEKWQEHVSYLTGRYGRPSAIAVVSAHYQTRHPEVGSAARPAMHYDYSGFPAAAYALVYTAPGAPALATEMVDALRSRGMSARANPQRPYDHSVFVPLLRMFPAADIPVVPIAVLRSDDPGEHIRIGEALRRFRERGVLFIGSGSSMHHFDYLYSQRDAGRTFNDALTRVLTAEAPLTPAARREEMVRVKSFPGFDEAHPSYGQEHLMPLLTLLGTAGGRPAREVANMPFLAANVRHYLFEE
ncbi:extradiol ring-cleavage dioxygenase class III protein subunit B [Strigomonas culicis]|uniref:Extradiol ring-cleavage dioxygenase class III protein subunit B n=1 Tax=Strigomonas culicis TaxID=28005 RepID=S9VQY4_9TRYP|nr:extradiol ring-cleavage dioxygenase class III protein subunit B [Strigomonas culicis]|eukprot:EPY29526.1 extradiol ring-cleavage dioxygenase class III protein subunit B [Strigomonas culicis]